MSQSRDLRQFIRANRDFFCRRVRQDDHARGLILVDLQTVDEYFASSMMRVAVAVSEVLGRRLMVLNAARASRAITAIVKSYCPKKVVNIVEIMFRGLLCRFAIVIKTVIAVKDGGDLAAARIDDLPVGVHIYDYLMRRSGKPMIGRLSWKERMQVLMELAYACGLQRLVNTGHISYMVLPDNCYRSGLLFEVGKARRIPSLAGIDLNGVSIHKYESEEDYKHNCRTPDVDIIDKIVSSTTLLSRALEYFKRRTSAQLQQHDVVRAYAHTKCLVTRDEIVALNQWDPAKRIAVVMAHVFCDAPHSAPNLLFQDYAEWLVETCLRLSQNRSINFVVKEHPSAPLHGEDGLTKQILQSNGLAHVCLATDINTKSLFEWADVIITCGGTAAMEMPCYEIPVVVAAEPANYFESYVHGAETAPEYFGLLDRIHTIGKLDDSQVQRAIATLYLVHEGMTVRGVDIGLGSQGLPFGVKPDFNLYCREMMADFKAGSGYATLVKHLQALLRGPYCNLFDPQKVEV